VRIPSGALSRPLASHRTTWATFGETQCNIKRRLVATPRLARRPSSAPVAFDRREVYLVRSAVSWADRPFARPTVTNAEDRAPGVH